MFVFDSNLILEHATLSDTKSMKNRSNKTLSFFGVTESYSLET